MIVYFQDRELLKYFFNIVATVNLENEKTGYIENKNVLADIRKWLENNGEGAVLIDTSYASQVMRFKFENTNDALLFKLAWGGENK